jgi:hypothetical protein
MRRVGFIAVVCSLLPCAGCVTTREAQESGILVPLVALLVDPERYDRMGVSSAGYLAPIFGRPMLLLTREHAWMDDMRSAIPVLSSELEGCFDRHVELSGTFFRRENQRDYAITDVYWAASTSADRDVEVCFSARSR